MIALDEKTENYIYKNNYGSFYLNNKKYYFKLVSTELIGIESCVEELASLVGIKCAHYELVEINGYSYYVSEDIAGNDEFYPAYELGFFNNSLYDIWDQLELRYPNNKEFIMNEIIKIYLFDILILNNDRNYGNYGFKVVNGDIKDVYIFDNEYAFSDGQVVLSSKMEFNDKLNKEANIKIPYGMEESIRELEYFLETSSIEYADLFKEMFSKLEPEIVNNILKKYKVYNIRYLINIYKDNYCAIGNLLNIRGLK